MSQILELKPNQKLLDYNFQGYKLSLQPTNITKAALDIPIDRIPVDTSQFSFLHAKIFGLYNFLIGETTSSYENVYFVDHGKHVKKGSLNPYTKELEVCTVWSVPTNGPVPVTVQNNGNYNVSLNLVSENLAILSDGLGTFFILDTGDRGTDCEWQLMYAEVLLQSESFYIQDAVLKESELHVLLCRIEQGDKKAQLGTYWNTFDTKDKIWKKSSTRELLIKGDINYLYLERTCEAIYVASTVGCTFRYDSKNEVLGELKESEHVESGTQASERMYKWSQDSSNVVIHFIMSEVIKKEDVVVSSDCANIKVMYKDISLLNGMLVNQVVATLTNFTVSKNLLEISLVKEEQNVTWSTLLKEDGDKELTSNETYIGKEVKEKLDYLTSEMEEDPPQGITFNTEEIEECDYSNDELTIFERLCVKTHKVTHKYYFGSNQVLLSVWIDKNLPPSLGVRHDVDVCLWEPHCEDGNFELKHVATLLAIGYIQASKQEKKYLTCPSDMSYSLICESSSHMFLYRQKKSVTSGELKNRKSGARIDSVAEQQVISIPNEEIFGIYVSPSAMYVLGDQFLMHIKT